MNHRSVCGGLLINRQKREKARSPPRVMRRRWRAAFRAASWPHRGAQAVDQDRLPDPHSGRGPGGDVAQNPAQGETGRSHIRGKRPEPVRPEPPGAARRSLRRPGSRGRITTVPARAPSRSGRRFPGSRPSLGATLGWIAARLRPSQARGAARIRSKRRGRKRAAERRAVGGHAPQHQQPGHAGLAPGLQDQPAGQPGMAQPRRAAQNLASGKVKDVAGKVLGQPGPAVDGQGRLQVDFRLSQRIHRRGPGQGQPEAVGRENPRSGQHQPQGPGPVQVLGQPHPAVIYLQPHQDQAGGGDQAPGRFDYF